MRHAHLEMISNCIKHSLATSTRKPLKTKRPELLDSAIQQILDDTIRTEGLAEIVELGNEKSIFDDAFLARVKEIEEKNLAQAALEQLLRGQISY